MRYEQDELAKKSKERSFVRVLADHDTSITQHANPDDKWSSDSTSTDVHIKGVEFVGEDEYWDLVVPFAPKSGEEYFLVYVNYDTGDSFSHHAGHVMYLDLFKSAALADELAKKIKEDTSRPYDFSSPKKGQNSRPNTVQYKWDDGQTVDCYTATWKGYFETFNHVAVESVSVKYSRKYK